MEPEELGNQRHHSLFCSSTSTNYSFDENDRIFMLDIFSFSQAKVVYGNSLINTLTSNSYRKRQLFC